MSESAVARPTVAQWVGGARPRTLPAAISPVLVGSALAADAGGFVPVRALLALLVAVALQIGVNYANDYSDGIRGTDAQRVGPVRLVGAGLAEPRAVRTAAWAALAVAGIAGLALVVVSGHWWLLAVGAAAVAAAWSYTGGRRPYGYQGLGELAVFVFFGLVATWGSTYVQLGRLTVATAVAGAALGALASAILVANNLRDLRGDAAAGKRTLATRWGDRRTRGLYVVLVAAAGAGVVLIAARTSWWVLLGLVGWAVALPATRAVLRGATGPDLVGVLKATGTAELALAVLVTLALALTT